ncbi:hypothetical protein CSOJ01_06578 [Colletotrichum sojae]|uniref:Uncharacterized protein n=1 Tax=Colletotrichum sojae TaxID=2175907 RepID=A0A8H6JBF2_9PEZI|nr:hypothetical protein CSOJ01_06578 [Colletotrichum sojae]
MTGINSGISHVTLISEDEVEHGSRPRTVALPVARAARSAMPPSERNRLSKPTADILRAAPDGHGDDEMMKQQHGKRRQWSQHASDQSKLPAGHEENDRTGLPAATIPSEMATPTPDRNAA